MPELNEVCAMIRQDIANDVRKFEHAEFSGPNVAEWIGCLSAAVDALAGMIAVLDERSRFPS